MEPIKTKQNKIQISDELFAAKGLAEQLVTESEELKIKLAKAMQIAQDAVRAKQQFLSNISHEIRTPMNAIIGFTKVLARTELSERQQEYLTAISISTHELTLLIDDLLDLAKVDAGKMTFERTAFKLANSFSTMLHLFDTKIREKNLELIIRYDHNIPDSLIGDPVRLNQILLNLVSNAVKFTSTGKIKVEVKLLTEDEEGVSLQFSVEDTGIGIAANKLAHIFEVFQQESSGTSRLYGGTGIGLTIVKQLVEYQGGDISVKSKIDEGSTFTFKLTFSKANAEIELIRERVALKPEIDLDHIRVLVVEDIALNQSLMKILLNSFKFENDIAENGKIAIEKLQNKEYDIILMDLHMPEMNGFEATEFIRNRMNSKVPIIALTADVTTVDLAKCKAVGMDDYLSKPVDDDLLFNKIIELVKSHRSLRYIDQEGNLHSENNPPKSININHLIHRTKSNPKMMMDMISLYLSQTPPLISAMKQGLHDKDWNSLQAAVHKMIPSFSIMGISSDFENIAIKVQAYANNIQLHSEGIPDLVMQLETVCSVACKELEDEFNAIKNLNA